MDLDWELKNWGRWARATRKQATCGSAERHYRAPFRQWIPLSEINIGPDIDVFAAHRVEQAWSHMAPGREKELLKLRYVKRLRIEGYRNEEGRFCAGILNRMRINAEVYEVINARARQIMRTHLILLTNAGEYGIVSAKSDQLLETV